MSVETEGTYAVADGVLYYILGKLRIKVTEHFPDQGVTMAELMEKTLIYSTKTA